MVLRLQESQLLDAGFIDVGARREVQDDAFLLQRLLRFHVSMAARQFSLAVHVRGIETRFLVERIPKRFLRSEIETAAIVEYFYAGYFLNLQGKFRVFSAEN